MNKFLTIFCGMAISALVASGANFTECPGVGNDTHGCELLVSVSAVNSSGLATAFTVAASSPDQGPYDASDDTLIGIVNNASTSLKSINFSGIVNGDGIFDFDGDGACTALGSSCRNFADDTGYAGPGVTFSGIGGLHDSHGTVDFGSRGLSTGDSAWFSLEEKIDPSVLTGTPEPATFGLLGMALIGLGVVKRRKAKA